MKKTFVLLISSIMIYSCATIFTGSKKTVTIDSKVKQPTTLAVDGYKIGTVTLPYTLKIKGRFNETVVKAETQNYEQSVLIINKTFNAVSVINLANIFGWGIDAATGAITKPEFKFYEVDFQPKQ